MTADIAAPNVTLYTQPGCGPCVGVKRALDAAGIPYTLRDIRSDEDAYARLVELGYSGTPVVEHPDGHFKGLDVEEIEKLKVRLF